MDKNLRITLRAARINAGLNQKEAAEQLGVSTSALHNYEMGKTFPRLEVIKRMEEVYEVSYDNLNFLPNSTV